MSVPQEPRPPTIAPLQAEIELRSGAAIALDVRERREFGAGTVPGAIHRPLRTLTPDELDRGRRYITICASGSRSGVAAERLREAGIEAVKLDGGMSAWRHARLPVHVPAR